MFCPNNPECYPMLRLNVLTNNQYKQEVDSSVCPCVCFPRNFENIYKSHNTTYDRAAAHNPSVALPSPLGCLELSRSPAHYCHWLSPPLPRAPMINILPGDMNTLQRCQPRPGESRVKLLSALYLSANLTVGDFVFVPVCYNVLQWYNPASVS